MSHIRCSSSGGGGGRHLIPLVSTFLREEPQRVVRAVVCIARESASESTLQKQNQQQPLRPASAHVKSDASPVDRAISHALQLLQHDYSRLFDALLASRDFDFLLRVGRRLQIVRLLVILAVLCTRKRGFVLVQLFVV